MASNASSITDEDGDNEDWIELYNYGSSSVNLEGYGLSDDYSLPFKWVFPNVSIAPGKHLVVWASGKNRITPGRQLHTNFNINTRGEEIILTNTEGVLIDELPPTSIPTNYSYGRLPDGTGEWFYYTEVTPGAPNSSITTIHPPDPPTFSVSSGFYTEGFTLTLSHPDPEVTIYYTLDGSDPSIDHLAGIEYFYKNQYPQDPGQEVGPLLSNTYVSIAYSQPLQITDRSADPNKLANISSTWHYAPDYLPSDPIRKATVVRAIAMLEGVSSVTKTHTYFVSEISAFDSPLPIASISLSEDALFDFNDGIYVAGRDFDNWRQNNPNGVTNGHTSANYRRSGIGTEKPASFQYFVDGKEMLNQNIGLRLHGSFSRHVQNKTFRLYARSEYDTQSSFDYPFFGPENSGSFKRLLLRNSGNDAGNYWIGGALQWTISPAVYFRDAYIQKMVSHLRFDTQDYVPVITYVNGEYWGLLNLRERYDHHYLKRNYGIHEADLELLTGVGSTKVGSNSHYQMTLDFISNNNIANNNNYNHVKTLIDTDNFMDYQIAQIFARNTDWPGNNIDFFRKRTSHYAPDAPYGQDGRWRWLMFDTDHGFGWSGSGSYTHNTLHGASTGNSSTTVILSRLLENQTFRNEFINRYSDLLNTAFLPERLISLIDEMATRIADEIPLHRERWNTLHNWDEHVELMREFAEKRPEHARNHIRGRFNLGLNARVTLNVADSEHGYIHLNSIEITENTPGISANPYPWSGTYFRHIPLKITAIPKPGFQFSHWSGASNSNQPDITVTPAGNISLTAHFVPIKQDDFQLIYFWLMDNNIENNIPLKYIHSTYSKQKENGTITFLSALGNDYPFSPNDFNWRKGSMERRNAPTQINYFPEANNNVEFPGSNMRGIQIKDPFLSSDFENTLIIQFSTLNYRNVRLSFAAVDEGAANRLVIDYFDAGSNMWNKTGLALSDMELTNQYKHFEINLEQVSEAENNAEIKLRIRFEGTDMTKDNGNRVSFNNFAVKGIQINPTSTIENQNIPSNLVTVFPNPTDNEIIIKTDGSLSGAAYILYDMKGNAIKHGMLKYQYTEVKLNLFPPGTYLLIIDNDHTQTFKIVKN